ncbi:hypothetical protein, partial [Campylobacter jejuni]|uniref:hypothetical protein n=1 Tax=Campylobacter jejuni TaxID=197 RepID=UPI002B237A24
MHIVLFLWTGNILERILYEIFYATIYIDEFLEYEILVSLYNGNGLDFTHAFLGLTKGKSPDE